MRQEPDDGGQPGRLLRSHPPQARGGDGGRHHGHQVRQRRGRDPHPELGRSAQDQAGHQPPSQAQPQQVQHIIILPGQVLLLPLPWFSKTSPLHPTPSPCPFLPSNPGANCNI